MTATVDIERRRGDNRRHTFTILDKNKVPVPLSAWSEFSMSVNAERTPTDSSAEVDLITGSLTTNGSDGKVFFIPGKSVAVSPIGKPYFYDVQAKDANGETVTLVAGTYTVIQDINKIP